MLQPPPAAVAATLLAATALPATLASPNPYGPPGDSCSIKDFNPGPSHEHHTIGRSPGKWPWQIYESSPFNPPVMEIHSTGAPLAPGVLFLTPTDFRSTPVVKEDAAVIMTDSGQLVWNGPQDTITNFRVGTFEGKQVLTYWAGTSTEGGNVGHGYGNVTLIDENYEEILTVCPDLNIRIPDDVFYPCTIDLHESVLTDRDTLLISTYNVTPTDLRALGGPQDGYGFDCVIFELDPRTGDTLFQWSAQEHVPVSASYQPSRGIGVNQSIPLDWFHVNSVEPYGEDQYLINARHTWAVYLVDRSGEVLWTLQGDKGGDFGEVPEQAKFKWQHDVRLLPYSQKPSDNARELTVTLFNNNNMAMDNGTFESTGLELTLPLPPSKNKPPIVNRRLTDPGDPIYASSQGSYQVQDGTLGTSNSSKGKGDVIINYGQMPVFKEFGAKGNHEVKWSGRVGLDNAVQVYRTLKYDWHAKSPSGVPSLVVRKDPHRDGGAGEAQRAEEVEGAAGPEAEAADNCGNPGKAYVSWNGATDVCEWAIYQGSSNSKQSLQYLGRVPYRGFETSFGVAPAARCVKVVPVVDGREVVGKGSRVVCS
ncbi:MAG: hypothetical protein M1831_006271 [Alyxoria varia]|nr:MAG: hypothetical protein M1831_006271 [Alyxoria varia]